MMFAIRANYHAEDDPLCTCADHEEDIASPALLMEANSAQEAMEQYVEGVGDPDTNVTYRIETIEVLDSAEFRLGYTIEQRVELGVV